MRSRRIVEANRAQQTRFAVTVARYVSIATRRRDAEEIGRRKETVTLRRKTVESALKAGRLSADS